MDKKKSSLDYLINKSFPDLLNPYIIYSILPWSTHSIPELLNPSLNLSNPPWTTQSLSDLLNLSLIYSIPPWSTQSLPDLLNPSLIYSVPPRTHSIPNLNSDLNQDVYQYQLLKDNLQAYAQADDI